MATLDFKAACEQLTKLELERAELLVTMDETDNDAEYNFADKRIDAINEEIESLVVRYVREANEVSDDERRAAMELLTEQERKHDAMEQWIYDERPPVNL